jgi:hypothetical protein
LGVGPFQCWADIRLPLAALAAADPAVAGRRRERVEAAAGAFRVDAGRCGCCRLPSDDLYVIVDATGKRNAAVCRPCLAWAGDAGLLRKAAHLDHEHGRKMARVSK